ncbi:hypothetical protein Vretimale_1059 [Volvox reticuliferus]|nr:hypothetical protein Vretifemale_10373 [Volvox reticuliferus]GIL94953.1 hypothetical protein Vretimale_1059 [Volvox reticuliferus]
MSDPRFVPHIARRLRAFHDLRINAAAVVADCHPTTSSTAPNLNIPGSQFSSMGPSDGCSGLVSEPPSQWDAIFSWLAMAEGLSFAHDPAKQAAYDKVNFRTMRTELKTLREMCSRVGSPRVLCHNDLLSGNILVVQPEGPAPNRQSTSDEVSVAAGSGAAFQSSGCDGLGAAGPVDKGVTAAGTTSAVQAVDEQVLAGGELQFIDFEYSCYGPRGFDWGNHFNEYAGFDCVYDRFPTPVQQKFFFRNYLKPGELEQLAKEHIPMQESRSETITLAALEEAVLERLVAEACVFALASHAYWGVWSFIQARYSPIDFDYLEYSQMRWAEYYRRKDEFFALVDRLFPPSH